MNPRIMDLYINARTLIPNAWPLIAERIHQGYTIHIVDQATISHLMADFYPWERLTDAALEELKVGNLWVPKPGHCDRARTAWRHAGKSLKSQVDAIAHLEPSHPQEDQDAH